MSAIAAIVGSALSRAEGSTWRPQVVETPFGPWTLHEVHDGAYVSFRHGLPHRLLPHQVPWRAQAWALAEVGCRALLVTSSAGVLDPALPLHRPIVVGDLLMLENRLPDGTACTMWPTPDEAQGHLLWEEGPCSEGLLQQLEARVGPLAGPAVFAWQLGPRIKTRAESEAWRRLGAQVNSMSLAPEVVLANELGMATLPVVVGHKRSGADSPRLDDVGATLDAGRQELNELVATFLGQVRPVPCGNRVFRFSDDR